MLDPAHYSLNTSLQVKVATYVVENYLHLVKWRPEAKILDVGTGDGSVFMEVLLPRVPNDFKEITVSDISEDMLHVLGQKVENHAKISLLQLDVATECLPEELRASFDHIFSFYCLQLVKDQRQAIRNLFDLLKPPGNILLTVITKHLVFDVYEKLAELNKWKCLMANFRDVGVYNRSSDARADMEGFLEEAGFGEYKCEVVRTKYTFRFSEFWRINPFIKTIPEKDLDEYKRDYMGEVKKSKSVTFEKRNGEDLIRVEYQFLVVYATR